MTTRRVSVHTGDYHWLVHLHDFPFFFFWCYILFFILVSWNPVALKFFWMGWDFCSRLKSLRLNYSYPLPMKTFSDPFACWRSVTSGSNGLESGYLFFFVSLPSCQTYKHRCFVFIVYIKWSIISLLVRILRPFHIK